MLDTLADDVLAHLTLAAGVLADLRPQRRSGGSGGVSAAQLCRAQPDSRPDFPDNTPRNTRPITRRNTARSPRRPGR